MVPSCHSEQNEESRKLLKNGDSSFRFALFRMTKPAFLEWTHRIFTSLRLE